MDFTLENIVCFIVCLAMFVGTIMYFIHDYNKNIK